MTLTPDGAPLSFSMTVMGDGLCATPARHGNVMFNLWLRPEPDADKATKLTCVLIATRISAWDSATLIGDAAVPQYFELVPEKN